jgi:RNA polymerase sigma-70 factor (ECF subfamily)
MEPSRSDDELLVAAGKDPEAFGVFYRRHVDAVLRYLVYRTRNAEEAAELTAEVFAAALESSGRFKRRSTPARAWLFGIVNHKLADSRRRQRVADAARRRLGVEPLQLDDLELERVEELADAELVGAGMERLVADLPPAERDAVVARVLNEGSYAEVAARLGISQPAARQRVSRGLARLAFWLRRDEA